GQIRAADELGVEEAPLAQEMAEVVEAVLELGPRSAAARVEDVRVQVPARVDQPEARERAEREAAANRRRRVRAEPALDPAEDVVGEHLVDPLLEAPLLARHPRLGGDERRLGEAIVEEVEDGGRIGDADAGELEERQETRLGAEARVVLGARRLDELEAETLQPQAA